MRLKRKIISLLLSLMLFVNAPLFGFTQVYADGVAYDNPLFIPFTTLVTTALIGAGIIGKNAIDASNQLVQSVSKRVQEKAIQKALEDNESPFIVYKNGEPQQPNNDNKNGKWFAIGATTALGTGLACEKGAVEMILQTAEEMGSFDQYQNMVNTVSINEFKNQCTASNVALQLANIDNYCVTQFNDFLKSTWWNDKAITQNDVSFITNVYMFYVLHNDDYLPRMSVKMLVIPDGAQYVRVINDGLKYGSYTHHDQTSKHWYINTTNGMIQFLDRNYNVLSSKYYMVALNERKVVEGQEIPTLSVLNNGNNVNAGSSVSLAYYYGSSYAIGSAYAYQGYKYKEFTPWEFTQNVYNYNQTLEVQFPDWLQPTLEILSHQLQGIQIGIDSIQPSWEPTQEQVQSGEAPTNIINQYINYYENPAGIPDDVEPEPNPDPEPNPEPEQNPDTEPVPESALDAGAESLWDWALSKIVLPSDIWDKVPFSIPYDMYLLVRGLFPTSSGGSRRKLLSISKGSTLNPDGITISSNFDAYGQNTRVYQQNNRWTNNAPIINLDLHFTYHDAGGKTKVFDYVKTIDLGQYGYFAMIIYIGIYISWMAQILLFLRSMFQ